MSKNISLVIFLLITVFVAGCSATSVFMPRLSAADGFAAKTGFIKEYLKAGDFTLITYRKLGKASDSITIYIEGDGRAWDTKHRLSDDPTPLNPIALKLAAVDPADNVAYIARPGQYSLSGFPDCNSKYWSEFRFAPEVISSFNIAIDILKEKSAAKYVGLVGYSGGGAIAVLVAAYREDIIALRTVAGNLNPDALSEYHHVSYLKNSMNPLDVVQKVAYIPQRHFVGARDKIVPITITESFVKMEGGNDCVSITVVDGVLHNHGWQKRWGKLLEMPLAGEFKEK
jgi:hypothetical protein